MPFSLLKRAIGVTINKISSLLTSPRCTYRLGEPFFCLMGLRRKDRKIELAEIKKVLVVRLDEIGDTVMFSPFLRELRGNLPDAWITLVVKPSVYNLVELCPYVNEVLTYDWNIKEGHRERQLHGRALKLALEHLWRRRFDMAIVPRWDADHYYASFVAYLSGASWRVGYSENIIEHKSQANRGYDGLFTHLLDDRILKHEVERSLDLLRFIGFTVKDDKLELWVSREEEVFAEQILKSGGVRAGGLVVAFAPGAREQKRMWPISNFIELGSWLKKEYDAHILVMGGHGEESLGHEIRQRLGDKVIDLVGKTTLRQAGALMKHCSLFVGNDTGTMHLAAAAGIPVIEISCHPKFGAPSHSNSPIRFGPWRVPSVVLQPESTVSPCSDACSADQPHCINGVAAEQVKEAVAAQLKIGS